jgi:hypothetical protein
MMDGMLSSNFQTDIYAPPLFRSRHSYTIRVLPR